MATKKPAATSKAVKASPGTAMTIWEEEMKAAVVAQGKSETLTGGFKSISFKSGCISIDGNQVDDNELNVVILASTHENQFYTGRYNPDEPSSPVCYAFGSDDDTMAPHPDAPEKQHDTCNGCPNNEWGSAEVGRGKACKNVRRMVVVTEDSVESTEALSDAEARMLKLPVTSVKNYANYVKTVLEEDLQKPTWAVVTQIKAVPDASSQFKVKFGFQEVVKFDQKLYDAMKKKVKDAESTIANAYPVFTEDDKPARSLKGKSKVAAPVVKGKVAAPAAKRASKY